MKRLAPIGFAALLFFSVLNIPKVWATPASADSLPRTEASKNAPRVTRDNFVSLSLQQSGFVGQPKTHKIEGHVLSYFILFGVDSYGNLENSFSGLRGASIPETRGVSNQQLDELIQKINEAHLMALEGNYQQPQFAVGVRQVLVVTISDKNNRDQQFIIRNYGNTAPKAYFEFMSYLRDFVQMKLPDTFSQALATAPPQTNNF